jgi:hypothetical protein
VSILERGADPLGSKTTADLAAAIRSLLAAGLTMRDTAERLGLHEKAVAAVCLCTDTPTVRYEHPQCPKHVLDVQRRLRRRSAA